MRALGGVAQHIQDNAGLDAGDLLPRINLEDGAHVPGHVDDDGAIAALPGQAGSTAARQQRNSIAPAERDSLDDILYAAGKHDADGHLTVVGAIGRVERPAPLIKAHLAADAGAQVVCQGLVTGNWERCSPGTGCVEHGKSLSH
ncbi:MAG TPA: hypothetical protein VKR83_19455 [Ktedonobacteraceae bacterium]|nr:hypothetical protein [Ktedonobacteraceae bacterium]